MRIITNLISWLKRQIRDQLGFTYAETNGMLALLLLVSCLLAIPPIIKWYDQKYNLPNYDTDVALLNSTLAWLRAQQVKNNEPLTPTSPPTITHKQSRTYVLFNINTATAQKLQTLAGIGPTRSTRIIKYRNKLGGFVRQDQYAEVYGLDAIALSSLFQYAYIASNFQATKLGINQATFKTLIAHPYLTYKQVQQIVRRREKRGKFRQLDDLVQEEILDQATFEKVKVYLTI